MRSILPTDTTTSTAFDLMGRCGATSWMIFFIVALFFSCLVAFVPPNTVYSVHSSPQAATSSLNAITCHSQLSSLSPLSSFLVVWLEPVITARAAASNWVNLTINASFQTLSESLQPFDGGTLVSTEASIPCTDKGCEPLLVYERNWVSFSSLSMTATVETISPVLVSFSFNTVCHSQIIAIVAFVVISVVTVITALIFLIVVPRRMRPSRRDHWVTLWLGFFVFLLDGPWLILKYYTPRVASQIFDLVPEIFHVAFLLHLTYFIAERTVEGPNRLFSSWVVRLTVAAGSLLLLVLQFVVTDLMPLCTLSIYIKESILRLPIYTISAVLHIPIVALLIFGVLSIQIPVLLVLIVAAFTFFILEAIYIVRMYIRFFIPVKTIGVAFGADFFYILMANIVSIFFVLGNLPVQPAMLPKDEPTQIIEEINDDILNEP